MSDDRRGLLFLNVAHGYDHFFLLIFPTAVLALERDWGRSYGDLLTLGTTAFIVFALATLPAGWLGDRWSRPGMMTVFFIGTGAAAVLTGLADGDLGLAVGLGLIGLFAAIYHPVGTALVVQNTDRPGRALGVNGLFGNLGVALAPLVTGMLVTLAGWRAAFILPGLLAMATGLLFARHATRMAGAGERRRDALQSAAPRGVQLRVFAVVAVAALFGGLVFNGTTVALPKVFEERLAGLVGDLAGIGVAASVVFCIASVAQIWVGRFLDRWGAKPVLLALVGLQVPCLLLAAYLYGPAMLLVALPLMLFVFGEIPVGAWLVGRYAAGHWRSRIYGVQYVLSLGVSALVVPMIAVLHERTGGFEVLFLLLAAAAALIFVVAWLLPGVGDTAPADRAEQIALAREATSAD